MLSLPSRRRPRTPCRHRAGHSRQRPSTNACACCCARATPAALSVHDAVRAAAAHAKSPAAADASAQAARELAVAAAQRPDPVLSLSLDNLPVEGPDRFSLTEDFMTMRSIGMMQEFTRCRQAQGAARPRFDREAEAALAEAACACRPRARRCRWPGSSAISRNRRARPLLRQRAASRGCRSTRPSRSARRPGRSAAADPGGPLRAGRTTGADRLPESDQPSPRRPMPGARWLADRRANGPPPRPRAFAGTTVALRAQRLPARLGPPPAALALTAGEVDVVRKAKSRARNGSRTGASS